MAGHLSPAVAFGALWDAQSWPTQSLCTQIPVLGSTSHWEQADVGTAGVGGISLGKCFALSITSLAVACSGTQGTGRLWVGCQDFSLAVAPEHLAGWQEWHRGIPCTWHRDRDSWQHLKL